MTRKPSRQAVRLILALMGIGAVLVTGLALWALAPTASEVRSPADFRPSATSVPVPLPAESARTKSPQPLQPVAVGQPAPDFSIETLTGERFSLAQQRGKVVGVLFSASWCATCIPETQAWGQLQREYGDRGVEVLMVSADPNDTPADMERFRQIARTGPVRYWAIDRDSNALVIPYQVRALDTTLIIDRGGRLAYRDALPTPYNWLKRELEKVL